jgi:hypothetical protein
MGLKVHADLSQDAVHVEGEMQIRSKLATDLKELSDTQTHI